MSIIKSYAVGNGDMYYIDHNSDNFTMIDCCVCGDREDEIVDEITALRAAKDIARFISTHPDDDHIRGLELLDAKSSIVNFYCVKNTATKEDITGCFSKYCELRDSDKAFYISKGCKRKWLNQSDEERKNSGINILWPDVSNSHFKEVLAAAASGGSPNNLSPIVQYQVENGVTALWFGDLETDFMELIADELDLPNTHIVFAPHHGRHSGRIPYGLLDKMTPQIIVIGEAPSRQLNYYSGYHTLTQNTTGDIIFDCVNGKAHIFTGNECDADFLDDEAQVRANYHYAGTLNLD